MTTNLLKPDKPKRQPKEGSKEAGLRDMREQTVKAAPDFPRVKNRLTAEHENLAAEKKRKITKLRESKALPPLPAKSAEPVTAAAVEPKESEVRKTKHTTKSKSRNGVNGKTSGIRPGSKLAIVAKLLTRPGGCTSADVLKATNWTAVSIPAQAKAAGLKLKKEKKEGSVTRYYAA